MSDSNDDILNDDIGDGDDTLDALDDDDLLLSDEDLPVVDIASNNDDLLDDSEEWIKAQLTSASHAAQNKISAFKNDNVVGRKTEIVVSYEEYIDTPNLNSAEADNDSDDTEEKIPMTREPPRKLLSRKNFAIGNTKKLNQTTVKLTCMNDRKSEVIENNLILESKKSDHSLISSSDSNILEDILELDLEQTEKDDSTDTEKFHSSSSPPKRGNQSPFVSKKNQMQSDSNASLLDKSYPSNRHMNHKGYRYRNPNPAQLTVHENDLGYPESHGPYGRQFNHQNPRYCGQSHFQNRLPYPIMNNDYRPNMIRGTSNFGPNNHPFFDRMGFNGNNSRMFSMRGPNMNASQRMPSLIQHHPQGQPSQPPMHTQPPSLLQMPVGPSGSHKSQTIASNMQPLVNTSTVPIILPRKVLINPNFKGGVEAATNQLLREQQLSLNNQFNQISDYELLRRQEEFITKNLIHVEKRRYERSPSWDKDRDRNYSPSRRQRHSSRGRDVHRPPAKKQVRRDSRDTYVDDAGFSMKYRKSSEKNVEPQSDEDEETKAYRLQIETQKVKREKMLMEKERRRKLAAFEKMKEEKKITEEDPNKKLKPIANTNKIISLKKIIPSKEENVKQHSASETTSSDKNLKLKTSRHPINKIVSSSREKPQAITKKDLLKSSSDISTKDTISSKSSNRRIVIKPSDDQYDSKMILNKFVNPNPEDKKSSVKGIFDRLDKKVGVSEADKRKIQRIVHKNND